MAVYKCKMCGGGLEAMAGDTVVECLYCGTRQTLPKTADENIRALFYRANLLRLKNEFDKAEEIYETILTADDTEAEAYWGAILCRFGIEYVVDPATYKRIPTCHRASYDSIAADVYYKKALEHADASQRSVYEAEAATIDAIQREILAISSQTEPFDVFICYKETDADGSRTQDSVIANEIYGQLTGEGFKVFYAPITLEDKLGSEYEPVIFAALNSARVMLAVGTKPEYFDAVWVKNEWSRFLKLMKGDRSKLLIPCYRDMDAYELPEEFARLQAQDMSKIGFINDIVRGIKKIIVKNEPNAAAKPQVNETGTASARFDVSPLLERAFLFLEDGDFARADEFCEQVLNHEPRNARAYLGKLLIDTKCRTVSELVACDRFVDGMANYGKAMRFGDEAFTAELKKYADANRERINRCFYESTVEKAEKTNTVSGYEKAREQLLKMIGYAPAVSKAEEYLKRIEELNARARASQKKKNRIAAISIVSVVAAVVLSVFVIYPLVGYLYGNYAPYINLYNVEEFEIKDGVTAIKDSAFSGCKDLKRVTLPDSVTSIGDHAFFKCSKLVTVNIPEGVTVIGDWVFSDCSSLTAITIPDGVKSIGVGAFFGCEKLSGVKLPDSLSVIGYSAFGGCRSIGRLQIPRGVTEIGAYAFSGCTGLTNVYFKNTHGWKYASVASSDGNGILPEDIANPTTAASCLRNKYSAYYWKRK